MRTVLQVLLWASRRGLPASGAMRRLALRLCEPEERTDGIRETLTVFAAQLEHGFLDSSAALDGLTEGSAALVAESATLVELATGRDGAERIINETMSVLEGPIAFLNYCTVQMHSQTLALQSCRETVERLLGFEAELQVTVKPLRVTQTMFRVESSRLPESAREAFVSLTSEIEDLHHQVRESFRSQFDTLSGTQGILNSVVARLRSEVDAQRTTIEAKQRGIREALAKLTDEIARNGGRELRLTSMSREVSAAVGRIVEALQGQDILNQQIQHVLEALESLRGLAVKLRDPESSDPGVAELARICALAEVQAHQVEGVREVVEGSDRRVEQATQEILTAAETMDHECVFLNEFSEVTAAANGTIQILLDIVEEVRRMVAAAVSLANDAHNVIRPITDVAGRLTGSVDRISHQMSLVALNAQIQAVQIGDGTGLEVLAAHTAGIAASTNEIGVNIGEDLAGLGQRLESAVEAFRGYCEAGRDQVAYMDTQGRAHEDRLHAVRDGILANLGQISHSVSRVTTASRRVKDGACLHLTADPLLTDISARLRELASVITDTVPGLDRALSALELDDGGYTMATEREQHRAALGRIAGRPAAPAAASQSAADEHPEVELF